MSEIVIQNQYIALKSNHWAKYNNKHIWVARRIILGRVGTDNFFNYFFFGRKI